MDPKCSWSTRRYQKNPEEILRRYGPGCSHVYVNAALFKREPGRQSSVLFVKVPLDPAKHPAGAEHRAIEKGGVWQLPGAECSRFDTTITQRLWLEVFNYLCVLLSKPRLFYCHRLINEWQESANHRHRKSYPERDRDR